MEVTDADAVVDKAAIKSRTEVGKIVADKAAIKSRTEVGKIVADSAIDNEVRGRIAVSGPMQLARTR